jgi:hypothetical protein
MRGSIVTTFSIECSTCARKTEVETETLRKAKIAFLTRGWKHKVLHLGWQCFHCIADGRDARFVGGR